MADDDPDAPTFVEPKTRRSDAKSSTFFARESDGTVRLRIRFYPEDAALFEEAAGDMSMMDWIYVTLRKAARQQVREARRRRPSFDPPVQEDDQR